MALRDIQTCSATCRKSFRMAGAILLRRFQKMCCSFRGRRSTLDVSIVIFRGMRSTFDVSCCVFLYIALAGLRQVATRCKFRGKRGILRNVLKIDGSLARNVSSLSGFLVASPCLRGKPQNLSFSKVSKQVVMSFCVAGVALCDIPTCLITCRNCQNWRMSRTKCWFFCIHASRLESLVFLWHRRVYGGSCKTSLFRRFPSRLSCRFAWQA